MTPLIIIIKSEVSPFSTVVIFSVIVCLRWLNHHMLSVSYTYHGKVFLLLCSLMMCKNSRVHYGPMVVFVCVHITMPHYHRYADFSEGVELLKC